MSEFYGVFHPDQKMPIGELHESYSDALKAISELKARVQDNLAVPFIGPAMEAILPMFDQITVRVLVLNASQIRNAQAIINQFKDFREAAKRDAERALTPATKAFAEGQQSGINHAIILLLARETARA